MLIETYDLDVETSMHSMEEFEYEAIARLKVDIDEALPYLNATLARGIYMPERKVLSWRQEGRNIGFWHDRIAVDHLDSREAVEKVVEDLVKLVNDVWDRRTEIVPDTTTHERLQPLALLKLLPQTNCKACGDATCFAFSVKLAAGQVDLVACTPLHEESQYSDKREELEAHMSGKWPTL